MKVEVAFATTEKQLIVPLDVPPDTTAHQAIVLSKIATQFPEYNPEYNMEKPTIGIFSHKVPLETIIKENDRIEIYRPLQSDPKQKRHARTNNTRRDQKKPRDDKTSTATDTDKVDCDQ